MLDLLPELLIDDSHPRDLDGDDLGSPAGGHRPPIGFPMQGLPNTPDSPACRRPATGFRGGWSTALVEGLGDAVQGAPGRVHLEEAGDHGGLLGDGHPNDVAIHPAILVGEHPATGDVPGSGLPLERVDGSLAALLPFHLGGEMADRFHQLPGGIGEGGLPVLGVVEEHPPGISDLLEVVRRLDLLSTEPRLLAHHEDGEWHRSLLKGVQEAGEPRAFRTEQHAGDAVIAEDVRGIHHPALPLRVGDPVLTLAGDAPGVLVLPDFLIRLPAVECGGLDHRSFFTSCPSHISSLRSASMSLTSAVARASMKTASRSGGSGWGRRGGAYVLSDGVRENMTNDIPVWSG